MPFGDRVLSERPFRQTHGYAPGLQSEVSPSVFKMVQVIKAGSDSVMTIMMMVIGSANWQMLCDCFRPMDIIYRFVSYSVHCHNRLCFSNRFPLFLTKLG